MRASDSRVVIIGAGAAGITAAIGLARRRIPSVVIEGAPYPGAENWSGAVYFCENLARPEILGPDMLRQTPLERRIVRRGILASDGRVAPGVAVACRDTFDHCYTVLRPVFDHDLAQKAQLLGVEILTGTTATGLIRDGDRVCGVLTDRGPIPADIVFLAEGDASNLVTREGLETVPPGSDGLQRPEFLQGIKEVLQLPEGEINRRFEISSGEGAAFEILLRNGAVDGRPIALNAGAFLYTNRDSLSIGIVAPLSNLTAFRGDHNSLMEWLKGLPALRPLLDGARSVSFGAKLIRGGGYPEMPRLALSGLAVGGAASGIGVDFPCPNFTGPATFMGYAFSEAVAEMLDSGGDFDQQAVEDTYVRRVMESRYVGDVRALEKWPHFVAGAREFFGRQVEITAGAAHIITSQPGLIARHALSARHLFETLPPAKILPFVGEMKRAGQALGMFSGLVRDLPVLIFFWTVNVILGLVPRPTRTGAKLIPLLLHDGETPRRSLPVLLRWMRWRFSPGLAEALHHLYLNDGTGIQKKLRAMRMSLLTRMAWWDLILIPLFCAITYIWGALGAGWFRLTVVLRRMPLKEILATPYFKLREEARVITDMGKAREVLGHDEKLACITYESDERTHIRFHAAYDEHGMPDNGASPLYHVCPARVYRSEVDQSLATSVAVLHENCIRCESCWRADDSRVDWGRTRGQKLVFETYTTADVWLAESQEAAARAALEQDEVSTPTDSEISKEIVAVEIPSDVLEEAEGALKRTVAFARAFLDMGQKSLAVLTGADQRRLEDLARLALGGTLDLIRTLGTIDGNDAWDGRMAALEAWRDLAEPRLQSRRFFHLEADIQILLQHHLPDLLARAGMSMPAQDGEEERAECDHALMDAELDANLDRAVLTACDANLGPDQAVVSYLLRCAERARSGSAREVVLEVVARRSPSLAVLLSRHLAALAAMDGAASGENVTDGTSLLGLFENGFSRDGEGRISGRADGVLLGAVEILVVATADGLALIRADDDRVQAEITGAIGLRGAGPGVLTIDGATPMAFHPAVGFEAGVRDRAAWDLVAVARGMSLYLQERALDHAGSRVQFPGLFKDIRGRDGLAKFGAVQAMIAGISQGVEILEGLRGSNGSGSSAWALASDLLGCSPRSISYLTGQVLGGMAFSEEDPVCRFYRDASALSRMPYAVSDILVDLGNDYRSRLEVGSAESPGIEMPFADALEGSNWYGLVSDHTEPVRENLKELGDALIRADDEAGAALAWDLGRLSMQVCALRVLAARTCASLERGHADEVLIPCLEAFARRVAGRAARVTLRTEDAADVVAFGRSVLDGKPNEGTAGASGLTYSDYLEEELHRDSGDLFLRTGDENEPCLTPELLAADPKLRDYDREAEETYRTRFERGNFGGKPYSRLVEELHHVPLDDVRFLVERGALRMVIPEAYLGLGLKKAAYYLECARMMRHGDPSHALIVMGSCSIGTTPLLIGLEQDLPAAEKALQELLENPEPVGEIEREIKNILRISGTPQVLQVGGRMKKLASTIKKTLQKAKATRLVFQDFLGAFMKAGMAGMKKDLVGFVKGLEASLVALEGWEERLTIEQASLADRKAAHTFYLKLISTGRISAFALTEPSAGSDTARIRSRAVRKVVRVEADPRGFYTFVPEGGTESRNLFTTASLEFRDGEMVFISPERTAIPIELRDFAYGDEDPEKLRCVVLDGERIDIHDMGCVDTDGDGQVYRYFCVNGAKMWITNGSIAGVMILYARTERGPTALMLDAHAEGLVVGKDEEKMGQRGSATNELTLQDVRVPVSHVIGIEGRGQENALETLNVGRAGLAVTSVGLMHEVLQEVRDGLEGTEPAAHQCYQIGRMALDLVGSESLAWQVVGRFDHKGTLGIRMESAVAKARCSEALHRVISRAEQVLSSRYALDIHELEKRRRDARVLTIYEGTNEIQRFLQLKDLIDALPLDNMEVSTSSGDAERASLDRCRQRVAQAIRSGRDELGARAWQGVHLQPRFFNVVEAAMNVSIVSATLHRTALAKRLLQGEDGDARLGYLKDATRLLAADLPRHDVTLLASFEKEGERIRAGHDPVTQEICDRVLLRHEDGAEPQHESLSGPFSRPLHVAVVVDPQPVLAPRPRVSGGSVREPLVVLGAADRAVLREALALRDHGEVIITVVGIGSVLGATVMKETLALGADHAFLLNTGGRSLPAPTVAEELADLLRTREALEDSTFDLVLGHEESGGALLPLARRMEMEPLTGVLSLGVRQTDEGLVLRTSFGEPLGLLDFPMPALCLLTGQAAESEFGFDIEGWNRARRRSVAVIEFSPRDVHVAHISAAGEGDSPARDVNGDEDLPLEEITTRFVAEAGLAPGSETQDRFEGIFETGSSASFFEGLAAIAIVETDESGDCNPGTASAVRSAAAVAGACQGQSGVLILVAGDQEEVFRVAVGEVQATPAGSGARVAVLAHGDLANLSPARRGALVEAALDGFDGSVIFAWTLLSAGLLAGEGRALKSDDLSLIRSVDNLSVEGDQIIFAGPTRAGRLRFRMERPAGSGAVQIVTGLSVETDIAFETEVASEPEVAFESNGHGRSVPVTLLQDIGLSSTEDPLTLALRAAGSQLGVASLAEAEFIIDVGYGVGSRDGIEEIIEPLKRGLEAAGVRNVVLGATRKVTLDLGILPESCQIGQTGVSVNPKVLLAIGVSGAPQHVDFIGERAVVFVFNKDPEAPLMVWNRSHPRPLVFPVLGDLFEEVPRFLALLRNCLAGE